MKKVLLVFTIVSIFFATHCLAKTDVKFEIIKQRKIKNDSHNYWATREIQFRVTNITNKSLFVRGRKAKEFFPIGFFVSFDQNQWVSPFPNNVVPKFSELDIAEFDNYVLLPNKSFIFTDLLNDSAVIIKHKRIIYISEDASGQSANVIESPIVSFKKT